MNTPPILTDRRQLARNRSRARQESLFLHDIVADEFKTRLEMVNKSFTKPVIVTGMPDFWADFMPGARIVTDDEVLDLTPGAHDLVIHALSLHWANDPVGQVIQSARALEPDGLFMSATFGGETLTELRAALARAEVTVTGGLSPRVLPMGEIRDLGALLQRAGLALPVADSLTEQASYRDLFALMRDLRHMGEGNALANRLRQPTRRAVFDRAAQEYAAAHPLPDHRIAATFEIIFLSGWAPHESQQKPLRPGTAQVSLARVLGDKSDEIPH